jgi:hypothetical protein
VLTVFVDESGADGKNRYLVHGALLARHPTIDPMRAAIVGELGKYEFPDELKWSTTSKRRVARDIKAVGTFFDVFESNGERSSARFQCLVVDQHRVNAKAFHKGDRDMCFYKLLYPLLLNRIAEMSAIGEEVHVILDERTTRRYDVNELRAVLRNGLRKKLGFGAPNVVSVRYQKSHLDPMLQVADFLTGAVCFHRNGHHLQEDRSMAKWLASEWIARKVGIPSLAVEQRRDDKFGIWTLRLSKRPPHRLAA